MISITTSRREVGKAANTHSVCLPSSKEQRNTVIFNACLLPYLVSYSSMEQRNTVITSKHIKKEYTIINY